MQLFKRLRRRLFIFQIFLLLLGSCAVAYGALRSFESDLKPDMTRKGDLIARTLAGQFERALDSGVGFHRLGGVGELFASIKSPHREILFVAAIDRPWDHLFYEGTPDGAQVVRSLPKRLAESGSADFTLALHGVVQIAEYLVAARPIMVSGQPVGWVLVGIDGRYVQQQMSEIFYDILVVLVVSLLLTFELLLLIMASASTPMHALQAVLARAGGSDLAGRMAAERWPAEVRRIALGLQEVLVWLREKSAALAARAEAAGPPGTRTGSLEAVATAMHALQQPKHEDAAGSGGQQAPVRIRMPLFVFFCAEELSRSFFPLFARSLYRPVEGLAPEVVISLPMMLFMLVVAIAQPIGGSWVERIGPRRLLVCGALAGAAGLAMTALAESFWTLVAWRLLTAAGYGAVFVAGQGYIIANSDAGNRAWGFAMFVGAVLAASIFGPAIGGMLAERIGYRGTFFVGAALALASALFAWRLLRSAPKAVERQVRPLRLSDVGVVMRNSRFASLVAFGAMPAKIILTGFLYYLAPMYLAELGNSQSAIGRMMMLYGLMMVLMTPLTAKLVDRVGHPLLFVVFGGLVSALAMVGIYWSGGTDMMLVGIVGLGIAQAASVTPQLALVPLACPAECARLGPVTVMGFFRLFERIGSAAGPLIAAFLLQKFGYVTTVVAIGCGVGAGCLLLGAVWFLTRQRGRVSGPQQPARPDVAGRRRRWRVSPTFTSRPAS